jgi:chromosome segregation ATPase
MFQPQKPATNGQAAIALTSGDTSEQLGEELARLEAERMADEAVAADAVMEARTQKEVKALFDAEIETERKRREEAEKRLEEVKSTLEKVTAERESEKESILKGQAAVEAQKSLLHEIQQKVDEQLHALATLQVEVSYEKERAKKLTAKLDEDQESVARLKSEIDSEKKALILARYCSDTILSRHAWLSLSIFPVSI